MSSKLSKIYSLKQEKKYKNETINILHYTNNSRITTPTLADKSLHNFKSIKPQVQSSRLNRPETGKGGNRIDASSKQKSKCDGLLENGMGDRYQIISSKSLQSRQGSYNTHRRQSDKTKKNSCSRLKTQQLCMAGENFCKQQETAINYLQKRLKSIYQIFVQNTAPNQNMNVHVGPTLQSSIGYHNQKLSSKSATSNSKLDKKQANLGMKQKEHINTNIITRVDSAQMIAELNDKFFKSHQHMEEIVSNNRAYFQLSHILANLLSQLHKSFLEILSNVLQQNQQKIMDIEKCITNMIKEHEQEIEKQASEFQKMRESCMGQIEVMLIKSLYVTDKINVLQARKILDFQKQARIIDEQQQYGQEQRYSCSTNNQFIDNSKNIRETNPGYLSSNQTMRSQGVCRKKHQDSNLKDEQEQGQTEQYQQYQEYAHIYKNYKKEYSRNLLSKSPQAFCQMKKPSDIRYGYIHSFR